MGLKKYLRIEFESFFKKRQIIILLFFCCFSLYNVQTGIDVFKERTLEMKEFQEYEKARIKQFHYYDQYGTYGFRLFYVPGILSAIYSNAGVIKENLNAFIDSGERMKIYEPFKGKSAFIGNISTFLNLTGFLLVFGSLLSLFYGFETFRNRNFLNAMGSIERNKLKLFFFLIISRWFILVCIWLLILISVWGVFNINGLTINVGYLSTYGIIALLMLTFFLSLGAFAGALRNKKLGLTVVFTFWIFFAFGVPGIIEKVVYKRASSIVSVYKMDKYKFNLMMNFEEKAKEQAGQLDRRKETNTEIRQQLFKYLLDNEFKVIMKHEQTMMNKMHEVTSFHHNLSLVFPSSFFLSVSNEISGRGYKNLIAFYKYAYKHKIGFVRFYGDKVFFLGETKIEPYLKGNENVFHAPSLLPDNFVFGLVFCILWIALPLSITFFLFNKLFQPSSKKLESDLKEKLQPENWKKNKTTVFITDEPELPSQFSRILGMREISYIMVPNPGDLPGMVKVAELCRFFGVSLPDGIQEVANKCISKVKPDKQALLILDLIKDVEAEFLVFDNFIVKLSDSGIELFCERLESLKKGRKIAYFSRSQLAAVAFSDAISKG